MEYYDKINGDKDAIPNDIWEEVFEGLYAYQGSGQKSTHPFTNVSIWELHKINTLNYGACGTYYIDGEPAFDFEIRDGDMGGSEVIRIARPDELETPKRYYTRYFFAPDSNKIGGDDYADHKKRTERAWAILRNNPTMQENQRKMAYDLTMCPSIVTRKYWNDYATKISAVIDSEQVEIPA